VYVKCSEDRCQAWAEGRNPELVDFMLPPFDEDYWGDDEETMPLNGEAATPDGEGDEATVHEASDDEDPDV